MARRNSSGEGTVYLRKDGRYEGAVYVLTTNGARKRVRVYGATRAETHAKLTDLKANSQHGIAVAGEVWKLSDYLDYWLTDVVKPNRRPATYAQCETIVRLYLKPNLGRQTLRNLTVPGVQKFVNHLLANGQSVANVHVIRKVLSAALTRAERDELTSRNVARLVELPSEERKEINPWSLAEVARFLEAVQHHRLYAAYLMLFYGLRRGELLGLRWQDIDVANSKIRIRQQLQRIGRQIIVGPLKTAKSRRDLPLLEPVAQALSAYHHAHAVKGTELIFTTTQGTPIDPGNFLREFKKICQRNGLRVIAVHHVRHTVATLLKSHRVADRDIQLILGHSRIVTTQEIYQHDDDDSRRTALQRLAGSLFAPEVKVAQSECSGSLVDALTSDGSRQLSRQFDLRADENTENNLGGAYRIRTDDLFHAMNTQRTIEQRVTGVDEALKVRRRTWIIGIVAVNLAVKNPVPASPHDHDLAS
ncbi:tyrosine-type recombinase/integrase [Streptomyces cyaneofuscatus]|uniref:tyrosine-type recombinase/integrase n=1 Tax=Streptomyces cyaneofuscatus TaxID=66883 RepID=UPI0036DAD7D2